VGFYGKLYQYRTSAWAGVCLNMVAMPILAQFEDAGSIFFWSLVLIGLVVAATFGVMWIRRWMRQDDDPGAGFTLSDLRELHRQGKMTDQEFEKAKAIALASVKSHQGQ